MSIRILKGSCLETLSKIEDQSINTCITSPPYWGLRDYGTAEWVGGDPECTHTYHVKSPYNANFNERCGNASGQRKQESQRHHVAYKKECKDCGAIRKDSQLGLEETPEEFVENLVKVFREVKRVLRDDGTVWLNLGDSYIGGGRGWKYSKEGTIQQAHIDAGVKYGSPTGKINGLKSKDLVGIPWRVAFALQADGWYLRQDIIWHKPNPMPESVRDRCTKSHEYIFLLSKSPKYYFDNEVIKEDAVGERWGGNKPVNKENSKYKDNKYDNGTNEGRFIYEKRNKRSVWSVVTKPFKDAHFATFPTELIEPCVLAGCPEGGIVLDPFGGSGTTALVANQYNRSAVLCELNEEYIEIAEKRLKGSFTMFTSTTLTIE